MTYPERCHCTTLVLLFLHLVTLPLRADAQIMATPQIFGNPTTTTTSHTFNFATIFASFGSQSPSSSSFPAPTPTLKLVGTTTFVPEPRWAPGCLLLSSNVFCYGGEVDNNETDTNNLYELDLSRDFITSFPPWSDHTDDSLVQSLPSVAYTSVFPAPDNCSFYVYGGSRVESSFFIYDMTTNSWTNLSGLPNDPLQYRRKHSVILTEQGRAWIWGGVNDAEMDLVYYDDFRVFDTSNRLWETPTLAIGSTKPLARIGHTATLLQDDRMIILGGSTAQLSNVGFWELQPTSMADVLIFDMTNRIWLNVNANGVVPRNMSGHSAVLALDGKIVVFGGEVADGISNEVFLLDTSTFTWSKPSITGLPPVARKEHSAVFYKSQMLVLFGRSSNSSVLNEVSILDTVRWRWTPGFFASGSPSLTSAFAAASVARTQTPNAETSIHLSNDTLNAVGGPGGLTGIIIGSLVCIALVAFLFVRKPWRNTTPALIYLPQSNNAGPGYSAIPANTGTVRSAVHGAAYLLPGAVAEAEAAAGTTQPLIGGALEAQEAHESRQLNSRHRSGHTRPPLPSGFNAPPPPPIPPPHLYNAPLDPPPSSFGLPGFNASLPPPNYHNAPPDPPPQQASYMATASHHNSLVSTNSTPAPGMRQFDAEDAKWIEAEDDEDEEVVIGGGGPTPHGSRPASRIIGGPSRSSSGPDNFLMTAERQEELARAMS